MLRCASNNGDWQRADRELRRLAKERAAADFEQARWIFLADRAGTARMLGFASMAEYLEQVFGGSLKMAHERIRVARALEELQEIGQALKDGVLSWSAVRELTRVAIVKTESAWLEAVRGLRVQQIEQMVSGRKPGDLPGSPRKIENERTTLRLPVSRQSYAMWREAEMVVRRDAGAEPITEDEVVQEILRRALEGPTEEGRSSYQIVITKCPDCGAATQRGRGVEVPIDRAALECAECDAQTIDLRDPTARAKQDIPPATRRHVKHRDHGRCVVPGCRNSIFIDIHHVVPKADGGNHDPDHLATLCGAHHKALHDGRILNDGAASTGFTFRHADGTLYGGSVIPERAGALSEAFINLKNRGHKETEIRRTLDALRQQHAPHGAELVKRALQQLKAPR